MTPIGSLGQLAEHASCNFCLLVLTASGKEDLLKGVHVKAYLEASNTEAVRCIWWRGEGRRLQARDLQLNEKSRATYKWHHIAAHAV